MSFINAMFLLDSNLLQPFKGYLSSVMLLLLYVSLLFVSLFVSVMSMGPWWYTILWPWAPARGGGKSNRPPPPPLEIFFSLMGASFATFFTIVGAFLLLSSIVGDVFACYVFLFMEGPFPPCEGPFHHMGAFLLLFSLYFKSFFRLVPPPTKISGGVHAFGNGFQGSPLINSFQCILQYSRAIRTTVWCSLVCDSHIISKSKIITIKLFNYISACI